MPKPLTIGITDCSKFNKYEQWILSAPGGINVIRLSADLVNSSKVEECDGIILTGGQDVHPDRYRKPQYLERLNEAGIDEARDAFEWQVIDQVILHKKPLLGICRGLQVMNVYLGGSLIYDIESVIGDGSHHKLDGKDQYHEIKVEQNSALFAMTGRRSGIINSAHHQSIDDVAGKLLITATGNGNIVEALEWKKPETEPWMLLVQWHPERMNDMTDPFSLRLRSSFLEASLKG